MVRREGCLVILVSRLQDYRMALFMAYTEHCLCSHCQQCFTFLRRYQEMCVRTFRVARFLEKKKGKEKKKKTKWPLRGVSIQIKIFKKRTRNDEHKISSYLLGGGRDNIKRVHTECELLVLFHS